MVRRGIATVAVCCVFRGNGCEVGQFRSGRGLGSGLPAFRELARYPVGVQLRPGSVVDDCVEAGVEGVDQRLVFLVHRPADEVVDREGVLDDRGRITGSDCTFGLLRRSYPGVDLSGLEVRVRRGVVGKLHGIELERVHDVVVLHGSLYDADAL